MNLLLYLRNNTHLCQIDYLGLKVWCYDRKYINVSKLMIDKNEMMKLDNLMKHVDEPVITLDGDTYLHIDLFPHLLISKSPEYAILISKHLNQHIV